MVGSKNSTLEVVKITSKYCKGSGIILGMEFMVRR